MAMTEQQRQALHAELMAALSRDQETVTVSKADLRAVIDALDDFLEANASAVNNAIPQPARTALTVPQKARLLAYVTLRRYG